MERVLKKIYCFLFCKHPLGFIRFSYAALIPCILWKEFNRWWMLVMTIVLLSVILAYEKGWREGR